MGKIKRFGVLKTSSFIGLYSFFLGFIFSLIMWIAAKLFSSLVFSSLGPLSPVSSTSFSWIWIIILPFFYGIIGFVSSLIIIPIMNLTLKITKGIDLDLELGGKIY